tara:strand:+ start:343 stop:708 length:366 start_codon:yes stop_codon:yes gene_type:complete
MVKRTGPTNQLLVGLIQDLKKKSIEQNASIWKRIALDLEKPTRNRRAVNLSKINRFTKEDETIVVPGKVLGSGTLNHKVTISAFQFSEGAKTKLSENGSKMITIQELSDKDPKGQKIRIIG